MRLAYAENTNITKNGIDITSWLVWFLSCLDRALDTTEKTLAGILENGLNILRVFCKITYNALPSADRLQI